MKNRRPAIGHIARDTCVRARAIARSLFALAFLARARARPPPQAEAACVFPREYVDET
jgi:hypothetical protein